MSDVRERVRLSVLDELLGIEDRYRELESAEKEFRELSSDRWSLMRAYEAVCRLNGDARERSEQIESAMATHRLEQRAAAQPAASGADICKECGHTRYWHQTPVGPCPCRGLLGSLRMPEGHCDCKEFVPAIPAPPHPADTAAGAPTGEGDRKQYDPVLLAMAENWRSIFDSDSMRSSRRRERLFKAWQLLAGSDNDTDTRYNLNTYGLPS